MGIVYTLAVTNFQTLKSEETKVGLENLKEYLQNIPHSKSVELLCLDECMSCSIFVDGEKYSNTSPFDYILDDSVKIYRYDFFIGVQEESKKVYFNSEDVEEDVCFSYGVDKKGVGDQVLVEFKDKVYDFSTYLSSVPVHNSFGEVAEAKESLAQEILR